MCNWKKNTARAACLVFSLLVALGCSSRLANVDVNVLEAALELSRTDSPMLIALSEVKSTANGLELILSGAEPFSYKLANHDQPLHLTIDIPETRIEQVETRQIKQAGIQMVRFHEAPGQPDTSRLEVYLDDNAVYSVGKDRERLYVRVRPGDNSPQIGVDTQSVYAPTRPSSSATASTVFSRSDNTKEYRIGPGDVLDIQVYDEPDLSRKVRVSDRGVVSVALIGYVPVQGLTVPQVTERLESRLSPRYLLNPQVFVEVVEFASKKVFVSGAVATPMVFTMQGETTLMEVLSQISGRDHGVAALNLSHSSFLTVFRRLSRIDGKQQGVKDPIQAFHINLDQLLRQGDMTQDIALQSHDVIYVPEPGAVFIFGEVNKAGPVPLSDGKMSLVEAINKAGGFGKFAATKRTRVLRIVDGKEQVIRVDLAAVIRGDLKQDIILKPNDIVIVPETVF